MGCCGAALLWCTHKLYEKSVLYILSVLVGRLRL
jgi:hypothetical protein